MLMLSKDDIEFIKASREEIRNNRTRLIELLFKVSSGKDLVTGEDIVEIVKYEVHAVVTVMSSDRVLRRHLELGVEYKTGDIIVDINKEDFPADMDYESLDTIIYLGERYIDVAPVMLGLGDFNRYEFLGRRES